MGVRDIGVYEGVVTQALPFHYMERLRPYKWIDHVEETLITQDSPFTYLEFFHVE